MIRLAIRRPVAVTMAYAAVAALGGFAWRNIPLELFPETRLPRLGVRASWPGASPETVEAFLTAPLEAAVQQVRGVERLVSDSFEEQGTGQAQLTVEFARDTDMDFARLELSERIAALEEELPPGVRGVTVQPYVPEEFQEQVRPFLRYQLTGPYALEALRAHVDDVVRPALAELEGVGLVQVFGGRERRLEVRLDPERVRALGLTPAFVLRSIRELDLVREAGAVREGAEERTVTVVNRPAAATDVARAMLTTPAGTPVRVGDVATVHDTWEEPTQLQRIDGRPAVTFEVMKEVGVNAVRTADRVKERLARLEATLPYDARFVLVDDESEDIRRQLSDLRLRALVAALVIFVVLLGFLRSLGSAAVVFATIAFSVLIALNLVYFAGLSLNLLTLMGLAMGFGLVVDNAIVVLENVYRRWQTGDEPADAAAVGTREVVLPIAASTATTLIVFVPFVYLQGELRVFYVPLAVVVALTLLASLFVAFTFVPALAARLLGRERRAADRAPEAAAPGQARRPLYVRFYAGLLDLTLRHPWPTVLVAAAMVGGSWHLFDRYVTRGVVWGGGWGQQTYILVNVDLPRGSSLERTDQLVRFFEDRLAAIPEVERFTTTVNRTSGRIEVTFPDSLETTFVPVAIKDQLYGYSHTFTGAEVRVYGFGPSFYGGGGSPPSYAITVRGYNYERVREIAESLGRRIERLSRVAEVDTNASGRFFTRDRATEFVARVDRDAVARHGMTVGDLVAGLNASVGGGAGLDRVKLGGEEVAVRVALRGAGEADVLSLTETLVQRPDGGGIRLGDVVRVEPREVLANIHREDQQYERRVAYEFRGPRKLGDVVQEAVLATTEVPPGYSVEKAEGWRFTVEDRRQVMMVLLVSLLLVYMVTAALFESLRQPLCVLLTVPMAAIGIFLMFFYTGATFTREAYIGAIMTGGIVVNNAILLVDHLNHVRASRGLSFDRAVVAGTLERVRPILMTTATTVLGLLPLVLFSGADENIWNALGFTLIGGLLSSTLLVLTVTPALYLVMERGRGDAVRAPDAVS